MLSSEDFGSVVSFLLQDSEPIHVCQWVTHHKNTDVGECFCLIGCQKYLIALDISHIHQISTDHSLSPTVKSFWVFCC